MLPSRVRHAVNVMINLAIGGDMPKTAAVLAREERAPPKYLEIILSQLRRAGLLRAARGTNGGFYLARLSTDIRIIDIMSAIDADLAPLPCPAADSATCPECLDMQTCSIKAMFEPGYRVWIDRMTSSTLHDISSDIRC